MSNINTKDIKDFCSEEREGIILKQKIKIQALEKENADLKEENLNIKNFHIIDSERLNKKIFTTEKENKLLVEKLEEWKMMFKHGLNHLNNKIVWDISPTSQIHAFLKKQLEEV